MKIFCLTFLIAMIFCSTTLAAEILPPTISVSGEGTVETAPDRATISVSVVTRDKNPSDVQNSNARAAKSVIDSIAALGIDRKNISTGNYSFNPTYRHFDNGRNEIDGYEAMNSVTVIVDDLNLVGKIIDTALKHGANSVSGLNFGLRNKNSVQDEVLRLAVIDARHKAEVVASALGIKIVGIRNVSVNSSYVAQPRNMKHVGAMRGVANDETPIESGTLTCSASVHVEFEISQ